MLLNNSFFSTFFGTKQQNFVPPFLPESLPFNGRIPLFLKQIHSNKGVIIHNESDWQQFDREGDFLITNQPNIILGIATADCLPIIIVDSKKKVLATIHAGWRGSVLGIIKYAVNTLRSEFDSNPADFRVFFGPSAKPCCYSVGPELVQKVIEFPWGTKTLANRGQLTYFDLPEFNRQMLLNIGIKPEQVSRDFNFCTICNLRFCSYRRDKTPDRQITAAWLDK